MSSIIKQKAFTASWFPVEDEATRKERKARIMEEWKMVVRMIELEESKCPACQASRSNPDNHPHQRPCDQHRMLRNMAAFGR